VIEVSPPDAITYEITARHSLPPGLLHDLRTPLNHIIGYSDLLIEQATDEGQDVLVPNIRKVRAAGGHLLALFNENFSPVQSDEPAATTIGSHPAVQAERAAPEANGLEPQIARGLLLVVDDDAANRDVLERRLKRLGYAVATAENGRKALEMLHETAFDLVLLDIQMPEMDGLEVLKQLKADDLLRPIPVIMISAMSKMDAAVTCIEMGAEDYLPKPFDPTLL
jgi:sigma-B regulation protein RsbU (phosphoserine phosphatase)